MNLDAKTIATYDARAQEYARATEDLDGYAQLASFVNAMPKGAQVLDLGCGPGFYAAYMGKGGVMVDAVDASAEMVKLAAQYPNVTARQASFDDISGDGVYDGIWANFSLLHAPRSEFPKYLAALHRACKPKALFHTGMKLGQGAARDRLERFYTYYSKDDLLDYITRAGFTITDQELGSGTGLDGSISDWIMVSAHA